MNQRPINSLFILAFAATAAACAGPANVDDEVDVDVDVDVDEPTIDPAYTAPVARLPNLTLRALFFDQFGRLMSKCDVNGMRATKIALVVTNTGNLTSPATILENEGWRYWEPPFHTWDVPSLAPGAQFVVVEGRMRNTAGVNKWRSFAEVNDNDNFALLLCLE